MAPANQVDPGEDNTAVANQVRDFASGDWQVSNGKEGEFVKRWIEFLEWTRELSPGFIRALLIQDLKDPAHYVSLSDWKDVDSRSAWQSNPVFPEKFGACKALCDDIHSGSFQLAASIEA